VRTRVLGDLRDYLELQGLWGPVFLPRFSGEERKPAEDSPSPVTFENLASLSRAIRDCRGCALHNSRLQAVPGTGPQKSRILIIGEGPGFEEDQQGQPFVGPAGQLLTRMLQAIQLTREEVYITNTVKCRPPGNRLPSEEEIACCRPFLEEEIRLIDPAILMAMGNCAAQALTGSSRRISELRGRWIAYHGKRLMATFHPAFLLRTPEAKRQSWEDLKEIRREYDSLEK
jgi:uracil-DNA glycosylase